MYIRYCDNETGECGLLVNLFHFLICVTKIGIVGE